MQNKLEKYKCEECDIYRLECYSDIYNNSLHCANCKVCREFRILKDELKKYKLYRFMIWVLDSLNWVLGKFKRR